jgi:iron complex outermembrane receptor protein
METIGSIEIIKGPNSTSFGSGLGGVINLFAREIPMDEFRLNQLRPMEASDF